MNIAVIGSRTFDNYPLLSKYLNILLEEDMVDKVVSGGARGADSLAERWAKENNIPVIIFKADWDKYGRPAGIIRNKDIIDHADKVVAFWDGKSHGTKNSIDRARNQGKDVAIITE